MILQYYKSFEADYRRLPKDIQEGVNDAIRLFQQNPRHPSLHTKKLKGTKDIWESRVTRNYRVTFEWEGELVTFRRVGAHDILKKESR